MANGSDVLPIAKIVTSGTQFTCFPGKNVQILTQKVASDGVSNIMWRPTFRTHLAVTYHKIPVVHVWDLMQVADCFL
jgi:hypothetical protein